MTTQKQLRELAIYEAKLDELFGVWFMRGRPLGFFSSMLSLMDIPVNAGTDFCDAWLRTKMVPLREPANTRALLALLHACSSRAQSAASSASQTVDRGILAGFLQHNRWRSCLARESDALAFAILAIRCIGEGDSESLVAQRFLTSSEKLLQTRLVANLQVSLQEWLSPGVSIAPYNTEALAGALFGDAWMALVFEGRPIGTTLANLLCEAKPPFVDGLLPGTVAEMLTLPDLVGTEIPR